MESTGGDPESLPELSLLEFMVLGFVLLESFSMALNRIETRVEACLDGDCNAKLKE